MCIAPIEFPDSRKKICNKQFDSALNKIGNFAVYTRAFHRCVFFFCFSLDEKFSELRAFSVETLFNVDQCQTLAFGRYSITRVKRTSSCSIPLLPTTLGTQLK